MNKTEKLIIENISSLPMDQALLLARRVVLKGRISNDNKQYCSAVLFELEKDKQVIVHSELNKRSDKLVVMDHSQNQDVIDNAYKEISKCPID